MLRYHMLASGSNGNCTLVQTRATNILIDVGIPIRSLKEKLAVFGLTLEEIDAIFITHEHIDHTRSVLQVPMEKVYSGAGTCPLLEGHELYPYQEVKINDMTIMPIPISHDCQNGLGFLIVNQIEKLVYITDTGYIPYKHQELLKGATHYVIESNHDVTMLMQSSRPPYLIRRILSDNGHLNNEQCGEFLANVVTPQTKSIMLAHLSEEANDPKLALDTVQEILLDYQIPIQHIQLKSASRHRLTRGWDDETND